MGARLTARLIGRNVVDFPKFLATDYKPYGADNHQQRAR